MIEFKKNIKKVLPYDRQDYISRADSGSSTKWYGVSFQLPGGFEGREVGLTEYFEKYEQWFKNVISSLDNGSFWIVNHDRRDVVWFPNDEDNLTHLRTLFKQNDVPNTFKGALIFANDDLLDFSKDLISYPYTVFDKDRLLYDNLDISHSELPFIIKIDGHWCIDLLSTDKELLKKVINGNSSDVFIVKQYRGTSLW
jgi:hypothetical protein